MTIKRVRDVRVHALLENPCLVAFNRAEPVRRGAADQLATRSRRTARSNLNLRCNHVSWTGAVRFAAALRRHRIAAPTWATTALSCGPAGPGARVGDRKNENLRHLDLEETNWARSGVALATAITLNNTLRYLNVRNNRFDARRASVARGRDREFGSDGDCFSVVEIARGSRRSRA